jgi:hypothetical protein
MMDCTSSIMTQQCPFSQQVFFYLLGSKSRFVNAEEVRHYLVAPESCLFLFFWVVMSKFTVKDHQQPHH